jgi:hypothetical protein
MHHDRLNTESRKKNLLYYGDLRTIEGLLAAELRKKKKRRREKEKEKEKTKYFGKVMIPSKRRRKMQLAGMKLMMHDR